MFEYIVVRYLLFFELFFVSYTKLDININLNAIMNLLQKSILCTCTSCTCNLATHYFLDIVHIRVLDRSEVNYTLAYEYIMKIKTIQTIIIIMN